jgi:hypothetical protein
MTVIRRSAAEVCFRCGTAIALPHISEQDCERALKVDARQSSPATAKKKSRLKTRKKTNA